MKQPWFVAGLMVLLLLVTALLALRLGVQTLPWRVLLSGWQREDAHHAVLVGYRLPRVLLAIIVGAALALSGALVQGVVRNPLASPDILGVSHAASLSAVSGLLLAPALPVAWLPVLSFGGGMAALWLLQRVAGAVSPLRMALTGVALAATWGSLTDYLMLSRPQALNNALLWLTGSLWGRGGSFVTIALPLLLTLMPFSLWLCRSLDLLALGDERAGTLGVNPPRVARQGLTLAVALASVSVAVCGPIGFIGLAVPHLARRLVGGRHCWLLPVSALCGGWVLLLADLLARALHPPMELPAGVLTAIIGAPWFFWLLVRMR